MSTYRIEIKGMTHDWTKDKDLTNLSKQNAEKIIKKAIKAGRKTTHIRMVKEDNIDIIDKMEVEELIQTTKEFMDDDEISEAAIQAAGWGKKSVEKFGKTIGVSPGDHGFIKSCIGRMKGKKGFDKEKAGAFCASLVDTYKGTTKWREKK